MTFEASPYYGEKEEILGWGIWSPSLGDWVIDDGLDEIEARHIAAYLNGKRDMPRNSHRILRFYGLIE